MTLTVCKAPLVVRSQAFLIFRIPHSLDPFGGLPERAPLKTKIMRPESILPFLLFIKFTQARYRSSSFTFFSYVDRYPYTSFSLPTLSLSFSSHSSRTLPHFAFNSSSIKSTLWSCSLIYLSILPLPVSLNSTSPGHLMSFFPELTNGSTVLIFQTSYLLVRRSSLRFSADRYSASSTSTDLNLTSFWCWILRSSCNTFSSSLYRDFSYSSQFFKMSALICPSLFCSIRPNFQCSRSAIYRYRSSLLL